MSDAQERLSQQHARMIRLQLQDRGIHDHRVLDAIRQTPREKFVPEEFLDLAYADRPLPSGHNQTISQPYIVGLMLEKLALQPQHRVLEVGTGSGWQTAILSLLARQVFTIERIKPLLDGAFERLMELGRRNVQFRYADGSAGWREAAPFDRIIIGAAPLELPRDLLLSQLVDGGLAVLPAGENDAQVLLRVQRKGNELHTQPICGVRFVPMISESIGPSDE
jgi:protein-L-isoaspartate(D-aspartate) O-methyltransferase